MELKNRIELAQYFNKLGFKEGAEVGVEYGAYSKVLCEAIPGVKLHCVDSWIRDKDVNPPVFQQAQETLKPYGCNLIRGFSMDVVKQFKRGSLDFVYIDANHYYDYVMEDLIHWSRVVRKGGVVAGHDYFLTKNPRSTLSVVPAVDDYARFHNIEVNVIPADPTAKRYGDTKPNFWWIKRKK